MENLIEALFFSFECPFLQFPSHGHIQRRDWSEKLAAIPHDITSTSIPATERTGP